MMRLLFRLLVPNKALRWKRPRISVAYFDYLLRREYLPSIRDALNEPTPLLGLFK